MTFVPLSSSRSIVLTSSFGCVVELSVMMMWVLVFFSRSLKNVEWGMVDMLSNMTRMCGVKARGVFSGKIPERDCSLKRIIQCEMTHLLCHDPMKHDDIK